MTTPRTFVGAVVRREHEILLVRQSPGHDLEGQWTVPWGRTEEGETPAEAAVRESWEEGGVKAR
ncbi:MAG TPA: NUDIX domain-containing protein, partial [Gammaproteobacteria bacterium]